MRSVKHSIIPLQIYERLSHGTRSSMCNKSNGAKQHGLKQPRGITATTLARSVPRSSSNRLRINGTKPR